LKIEILIGNDEKQASNEKKEENSLAMVNLRGCVYVCVGGGEMRKRDIGKVRENHKL
jgi:iron only hydrogenase large subunit-like protein